MAQHSSLPPFAPARLAALAALACCMAGPAAADPAVAVAARIVAAGETARLEIDLSRGVGAVAFVLADPDRVVVDLPEVSFQIEASDSTQNRPAPGWQSLALVAARAKAPAAAALIKAYRFGLLAPGKSRVVIDLAAPARIVRAASEKIASGEPARLVVELARTDRASFALAVRAGGGETGLRPTVAGLAAVAGPGKPVVMLDPGHGGVDSGASSGAGVVEKGLVFDFARTLAAQLESSGRYRVVMTRSSDVFVALGDRVKLARDAHAALFVSLHADTLSDAAGVQGATIYTAADKASDAEAARLAEKENLADSAAGVASADDAAGVSDILADLTRRETRAYSHLFARTLVGLWQGAGHLNKNPQRAASFKVLRAPDVPSVLIELGYLSNAKDAADLASAPWREKYAGVAAAAIDRFFESRSSAGPEPAATVATAPH